MPRYSFPALITAAPVVRAETRSRASPATPHQGDQTPLEKLFPQILSAIQAMWGYPELNLYFTKLTIDDRGDRAGFPAEVWEELYLLMALHVAAFPEQRK
ncbi:hypothetical protein RCH09_001465 [Actimicrobium sp. GrIS 1.19]|uniref:hypothetical protein n=1 Tax=Actimicrobium sp. GrIS 1.19 TaxID=3071708 RepID=UPI002DFD0752|nr:hypothetical protein [Actimicrobium sp. GrIS 1.19]